MRAPLGRYVVRRLLYALPTLLGVTLAVFLLVRLIPGDPARLIAGLLASDDEVQRLRVELGLDRPMPEQYARFLASVLAGNFGLSAVTRTPVIEEIGIRMRATLTLAVTSTALAVAAGLSAGVLAAAYHNTAVDYAVMMAALGGVSVHQHGQIGLEFGIEFGLDFFLTEQVAEETTGAAYPGHFMTPRRAGG